ncbi:MAG: diguanylate cyclase, partial [Actinobacteria bacterium]|nr:diguanylate cyclase [Actinomycetota bacterium]
IEIPFVLDEVSSGLTIDVEASVGIALFPEHGGDVDTLLQRADIAMYVAKETHTGCDPAQGFFLGRPMPGHELPEWFMTYGSASSLVPAGGAAQAMRPTTFPN